MFVHIHPIVKKSNQCFFYYLILKSPFSNQAVLRALSEWCSSAQTPPTRVDWQGRLTLDPPWVSCHQSTIVSTRMSLIKRLRCFVVGCNNEYSSHHLLLTSEPLKTQRINVTFILKRMRWSPINIWVSVRANHSWSSFIYRISEYKGFYESSPFLIMC